MQRAIQIISLLLGIMLMAACSTGEANTVDDAVRLLQDLEDNGVWDAIDDGLDALDDQQGYHAEIQYTATEPDAGFTITTEVDADNNLIATVQRGASIQHYFVSASDTANDTENTPSSRPVIRLDGDQAGCLAQGMDADLLRDGLRSVFEDALADAVGLRRLAVIDTPDDEADETTIVTGRDAVRYWLESRFSDAVDVLTSIDNDDLQAVQDRAGDFTLDGELVLDDDTAALLALRSEYAAGATTPPTVFEFAVTQWGAVDTITLPGDSETLAPCP